MATYIMLTSLKTDVVKNPKDYLALNQIVGEKVKQQCPEVKWIANYSVFGPYDYVDVFEAPHNESAAKVALLVRSFGHSTTEIWPAVAWQKFENIALQVAA